MNAFHTRRQRVAAAMGPNALAVLPTAPERMRNGDSDYAHRFDSSFFYLTGFVEPQSWLVIETDAAGIAKSTLFCRPKDTEREIWDGHRVGPAAAPQALGVDAAFDVSELDKLVPQRLENKSTVWFANGVHEGLEAQVATWLNAVRGRARYGATCPQQQHDLNGIVAELRLVKDAGEMATMRRAGQISAAAHIRAMQTSAAMLKRGQDCREFHLEAELLYEFRRNGAQAPAYTSIVAAGSNACVLHYAAADSKVRSGELVLIDAGCELDGYASDITRTFPANGQFTPAQRELYDLVVAAQQASVDATKPGNRFNDPHDAAVAVLSQGMLDVGLLNANTHGSVQDVIEQRAYFQFYMHSTSHWLGLDVHDCGSYLEPGEPGDGSTRQDPITGQTHQNRPRRILREGMVLTLEPGIYVRPAPGVPERFFNIGIRIEDDALVTATGCELMSRGVPVDALEIERLMAA